MYSNAIFGLVRDMELLFRKNNSEEPVNCLQHLINFPEPCTELDGNDYKWANPVSNRYENAQKKAEFYQKVVSL
jgi:hypothetical protein